MLYLDLDELPSIFTHRFLWSDRKFALGRFNRDDFLSNAKLALQEEVRLRVQQETGKKPLGPIRLLTNLRYFGLLMNPISCYYCFDEQDSGVEAILLEVTNTPWQERHVYVHRTDPLENRQRIKFPKQLHVSPFMSMQAEYMWSGTTPDQILYAHMNVNQQVLEAVASGSDMADIQGSNFPVMEKVFDATLRLHRAEITGWGLNKLLFRFPWVTLKVSLGIYYEALKLFVKGVPVFRHPQAACGESGQKETKSI